MIELQDLLSRFRTMFRPEQWTPMDWSLYRAAVANPGPEGFPGPTFLSASPARCATTWLFHEFRLTPGVLAAWRKETNYYFMEWPDGTYSREFPEWTPDMRVLGDISPNYALLPTQAVDAICQRFPQLRVFLILRNPVERVWSSIVYDLTRTSCFGLPRREVLDIPEAVMFPLVAFYDSLVRYDVLLENWFDRHPREHIYIDWFDSFEADPESALRNILHFIGAQEPGQLIREYVNSVDSRSLHVPPAIGVFLHELQAYRQPRLEQVLEECAGLRMPDSWRHAMPANPLAPIRIVSDHKGWDIYYYRGQYHRTPTGAGIEQTSVSGQFLEVLPYAHFTYQEALERLMVNYCGPDRVSLGAQARHA